MLELGGVGIITAAGNIPEVAIAFLEALQAADRGELGLARRAQDSVASLIEAVFLRKNPIPLATFFNSPLYLPLVALEETAGGAEARDRILDLIEHSVPSMRKYQ
jgi:4-hydroxy-tetrahydrodipicolinate synthase